VLKAIFRAPRSRLSKACRSIRSTQDYQRMIALGIKPTLARITVARKIAAGVLAMWKNKAEYDPAKSLPKSRAA
jgi:hypothetical protein